MGTKITVIGAGSVGATVAFTLATGTVASEIVIIDINKNKADGEAMDILQGTAFRDPIKVTAGDYEDAKGSDIVVITSGMGRKPGQTRLELTQINVGIMQDIAPKIAKEAPNAKYIIVSNPVDILTYVFMKESGIPETQIMGSGTILDTARLRSTISEHLEVSQRNVHGYVLGEHGDSSFIPWSLTNISGIEINEYYNKYAGEAEPLDYDAVLEYVQKSGGKIISNKGATFYAIAVSVCRIVDNLTAAFDSVCALSTMLHGEYGIEDVCLSLPTVVGPEGVKSRLEMKLTEEEEEKLRVSAKTLKDIIKTLDI
ncbi:MAG: L-lactate dehydrogenase [Lachnospira sp.]|nr:L-lactate dehydrogenase [Lachnospira sp.]